MLQNVTLREILDRLEKIEAQLDRMEDMLEMVAGPYVEPAEAIEEEQGEDTQG